MQLNRMENETWLEEVAGDGKGPKERKRKKVQIGR